MRVSRRRGRLRADPLAQRGVGHAGVDARLAGARAALAEARGADDLQGARGGGPNIGPPESPWQVSVPPCGKPAQTIVWGRSRCTPRRSGVGGDRDLRLLERVGRVAALEVVPQPTIVSIVPAAHRLPSLVPATLVGALVELRASCSSVMSWPEVAR